MSRGLDLPEKANLWDISKSPTIVMTQKGSKKEFQKMLTDHGVEVVEFELLTPRRVMEYCYTRGFLQIMWECGGLLSAPAISSGVIHKASLKGLVQEINLCLRTLLSATPAINICAT